MNGSGEEKHEAQKKQGGSDDGESDETEDNYDDNADTVWRRCGASSRQRSCPRGRPPNSGRGEDDSPIIV